MAMKHLYVHIPFCRSRCAYCDFVSEPVGPHARAGLLERYVEALRAELAGRGGDSGSRDTRARGGQSGAAAFETIYLGGGTPTVLPPELLVGLVVDLAARLDARPKAAPPSARAAASGTVLSAPPGGPVGADGGGAAPRPVAPEFTIEANPGTIDAALLERLAQAGVTRLSLGVQSFAPALRAALGRRVTQREITEAFSAVSAAGWSEWNLDLVFGIPGQTWRDAAADLDAAVAAGPTHISLYDLTYTPVFQKRVEATVGAGARGAAGGVAEQHYAAAVARLEAAGYRRYEVSNFALPGHECRHNLAYWRGENYLGIGAAAVSTVAVAAAAVSTVTVAGAVAVSTLGAERRTNPRAVADYLAGLPPAVEMLSPATRLWEKAMLGLRTSEGVDEEAVLPVLDSAARDRLLAQGCLDRRYGKLRVNPGFLDVSNTVIGTLLVSPGGP